MKFNVSKVEYASHNLSLWYGKCPHQCRYCYVRKLFGRYHWATGSTRLNPKALDLCKHATSNDVKSLVIQFSGDPLPLATTKQENIERLRILLKHLDSLDSRGIPTKVLTKNIFIARLTKYRQPYSHIQIGMSITTDSQNHQETQFWEKGVHRISLRLKALKTLRNAGFHTWASMEPILPGTQISRAISDILETGVSEVWVSKGSYDKRLEGAFPWGEVANQLTTLNLPQIHLKKELRDYLRVKTLQTRLTDLESFQTQKTSKR